MDVLRWLRLKVDVLGHQPWFPDPISGWWYRHVCCPSGVWECRNAPDLDPC
jgi:hypothetical protein